MRINCPTQAPVRFPGQTPALVADKHRSASTEAAPSIQDEVNTHGLNANSISVVVEMQPGNVLVYKFIDERNGDVIQQIPAKQMLNLADAIESAQKARSKAVTK
jgi:uncharacterized FlaG/YvyC family protein